MKQILLLILSLLSMSLSAQSGNETTADYYRFVPIYEDPTLMVKGNNADSIVAREINPLEGTIDNNLRSDDVKITTFIINRGDTLLYSLKKADGVSQLYLSNDGRHLSQVIMSDSMGNARTVAMEACVGSNEWVNKKLSDGYADDSIVYTYYKDYLVEKKFYPNDYEPRSTRTLKFDENDNLIEFLEDDNYTQSSIKINCDSNGIWQSMTGTFSNKDEEPKHKTATIETELNERGDWVKMSIYEDGKLVGGMVREIFYKK